MFEAYRTPRKRKPKPMRPLPLEEIFAVLDAPWLYELLPGNGQDDYILQKLREAFTEQAKKAPVSA